MNILDIGIIIFILFGAVLGLKRGFTKELVEAIGFIVVIVLAYFLKNPLSVLMYEFLPFFSFGLLKNVEIFNILIYEVIAFLICLCALLDPNNTPSGTIHAHLPPIFNILINKAKKSSSVFLVLATFNKFADTESASNDPLNGGLASINEYLPVSIF